MQAKSLLIMSVSASALLSALPAHSQPAMSDTEASLIGLHQSCDGGDLQACIRFGFVLGRDSEYQATWHQTHPDWWTWESSAAAPVAAAPVAVAPVAVAPVARITTPPPELPVYEQPPIPAPGYIWTPGYWSYGSEGYFWVPGTWVQPPSVGLLWTPGYWGWRDGVFAYNVGYWGPHIGFYGGINYGFGYTGEGYAGGRWNNGVFLYNQTVNNFGAVRVTNVYSETVVVRSDVRVSFNGGNGGVEARPTPQQEAAAHEQHTPPTPAQSHQRQMASTNKALLVSANHGRPPIAATAKPGEFTGKGVVAAREAPRGNTPAAQTPTGAKPPETNTAITPGGTKPNEAKRPEAGPNEAKRPAAGPNEAKRPEPGPNEAKRPEPGPNEAKRSEPGPNEVKKPEAGPLQARRPEPVPNEGAKPPEKKGAEGERATLNNGAEPKSPTVVPKPPAGAAATHPAEPKPAPIQAAPKPHPVAAAHPPARPSTTHDKKPPG